MTMELVTDLKTVKAMKAQPPNGGKGRFLPFRDSETGEEQWVELMSDEVDLGPGDLDFDKGKKWAAEQRKKGEGE